MTSQWTNKPGPGRWKPLVGVACSGCSIFSCRSTGYIPWSDWFYVILCDFHPIFPFPALKWVCGFSLQSSNLIIWSLLMGPQYLEQKTKSYLLMHLFFFQEWFLPWRQCWTTTQSFLIMRGFSVITNLHLTFFLIQWSGQLLSMRQTNSVLGSILSDWRK